MWNIVKICGLVYIVSGAIVDYKTMRIPVWYLVLGSMGVLAYRIRVPMESMEIWIGGLIIGAIFLGVSCMTKQAIGFGDSWMISILGCLLGIWQVIAVLLLAFITLGGAAMVITIKRQVYRSGSTEIPFFPFLLLGYIGIML